MNRSHDHTDEAHLEDRLRSAVEPPSDPALAADWRLREELRTMDAPRLPPALRRRILSATTRPKSNAPWLAAAAVLAGLVAAPLLWSPPAPEAAADPRELRIALREIDAAGRRALDATLASLPSRSILPDLDLAGLPYAGTVRRILEPPKPSKETENS
ncbi:MAG: hypothetical protein R3323_01085 [Wenzhouxiangellaceae bacterium]|nr:hypothetical protein [Wenzhouxiangellaceae bacterium]